MKKSKPSEYAKRSDGASPSRASRHPSSSRPAPARSRRLSADWKQFASRVAAHLPILTPDQYLILSVPEAYRFVQFAPKGAWGMRVETVSNAYLEPDDELTRPEEQALRALGWQPPTMRVIDGASDDEADRDADRDDAADSDESPSWSVDLSAPVDYEAVAVLAVRTLVTVYGVRHPSLLQYYAFAGDGPTILLPGLGIPAEPPPVSLDHVEARPLLDVVHDACAAAADDDVRRDDDVFVLEVEGVPFRVTAEPSEGVVRLVCRLMPVDDVGGDLFELMNRMNANYLPFGYLFVRDGDVRWATEVVHEPIMAGALVASLRRGAEVVQSLLTMARGG